MRVLLENSANPKAKVTSNHYTALHIACEHGDLEAVKMLVGLVELEAVTKDKLNALELTRKLVEERGGPKYSEILSYL